MRSLAGCRNATIPEGAEAANGASGASPSSTSPAWSRATSGSAWRTMASMPIVSRYCSCRTHSLKAGQSTRNPLKKLTEETWTSQALSRRLLKLFPRHERATESSLPVQGPFPGNDGRRSKRFIIGSAIRGPGHSPNHFDNKHSMMETALTLDLRWPPL